MEILAITLGTILIIVGIISSIFPPLPGPPIAYGALLVLHFMHKNVEFSSAHLIIMAAITVVILIIDYFVPIWGTKKFGGSQAGIRGSMAGLIAGIFLLSPLPFIGPLMAIIVGPFIGAMVGELIAGKDMKIAFRSGLGSFFGFIMGTGLKLGFCFVVCIQFIRKLI